MPAPKAGMSSERLSMSALRADMPPRRALLTEQWHTAVRNSNEADPVSSGAASNRQSTIDNRQSAIGNRKFLRVWITRDEEPGGPLSVALSAAGLTPVLEPVLTRRVLDETCESIRRLGFDDWLVLTSVYAVEAVPMQAARIPKVAVVGEASRRAAEARGFRVELVSRWGLGKSLFDELRPLATTGTVCYPRSSLAGSPDPWPGVELLSPVLYETVARGFDRTVVDRIDIVSVASPSAVDAIGRVDRPYASIGPTTSAALRRLGIEPVVEAPERSFEGLARAIGGLAK